MSEIVGRDRFGARRAPGWLVTAVRFARVETATYLRDKSAIFWTFVYPVVLLVLMLVLFGGRAVSMSVDVEGVGPGVDRLVSALEARFRYIPDVDFSVKRVGASERTPADRVRIIAAGGGEGGRGVPSAVRVRLDSPPDGASGAALAIVGETLATLNLELAQAAPAIRVDYELAKGRANSATSPGASVYYVTGLLVLTLVSTALFGFTGPLIELRARGGLKLFQVMPISRTAFLAGFALCRVVVLVAFSIAFFIGGLSLSGQMPTIDAHGWIMLLLLVLAGSVVFMAAGLALAGLITSSGTASAVINLVNLPIMFLSDLFIPISVMPEAVQALARWSPIYQLAAALRGVAVADPNQPAALLTCFTSLGVLGAIALGVAALTFRWNLKR